MTAEVIQLFSRAAKQAARSRPKPDEMIAAAGDEWLATVLREFADSAIKTLQRTERPLAPDARRQLMRAVAAVRNEPEF